MFMRIIALFKDIRDIIKFKRSNDEYYENIETFDEAAFELGKLYRFQCPLADKIYIDGKKLSDKEKKKLELIEHRIELLFDKYPNLRRLK